MALNLQTSPLELRLLPPTFVLHVTLTDWTAKWPWSISATEGQSIIFMAYITDQQGKGKVCKTYALLIASTETKEINSVILWFCVSFFTKRILLEERDLVSKFSKI